MPLGKVSALSGTFVIDENLDDFLAFNRVLLDHAGPVEGRPTAP